MTRRVSIDWSPDAEAGLAKLTASGAPAGEAAPLPLTREERAALTTRVASTPRPLARPATARRDGRPLIDLSAAPSAMEQRFTKGKVR